MKIFIAPKYLKSLHLLYRRDVETVTIYPEVPPAVALKDTQMEDESEEAYDNYGNNNDHGENNKIVLFIDKVI